MTYKAFYNKVIALLPSADLRAIAKSGGHVFSDTDLLKFIDSHAPAFNKKVELFNLAAEVFTDKQTSFHAKKLAEHCRKMYESLATQSDDAVYVIGVKSSFSGDGYEELLAAKTFEDALATIEACSRRDSEDLGEDEWYRYEIKKISTLGARSVKDLKNVGELCSCEWDPKLGIVEIDNWKMKNEFGVDCKNCKRKNICLDSHDVAYPAFLKPFDLVAYKGARKPIAYNEYGYPTKYSDIAYGVLCCDMTRDDNNYTSYVIALDSKCIKERRASEKTEDGYHLVYVDHDHPQYSELYKPNIKDLPDGVYADYLYAVEELKKLDSLASTVDVSMCETGKELTQTHFMHLAPDPYHLIQSGVKTVEVRLNDEKRRLIKRDDNIFFTYGNCTTMVKVAVTGVKRFDTFLDLMRSDLFGKTGLQDYTPEQAAESMYKYYTPEQERECGVVAIEFEIVDYE